MQPKYKALISGGHSGQTVILIVCPPSHDQQGRKFLATMTALRQSRFRLEALYLADTLNVHNGATREAAREAGTSWLARHDALLGDVPVTRWDNIASDSSFERRYAESRRLYTEEPAARVAVEAICRKHATTILQRRPQADPATVLENSINYMLEEIAGLAVIRARTAAPEVYPGEFFEDPALFHRLARVPLLLPEVLPVSFQPLQTEKESAPDRRAA